MTARRQPSGGVNQPRGGESLADAEHLSVGLLQCIGNLFVHLGAGIDAITNIQIDPTGVITDRGGAEDPTEQGS
jgi:hypothetical protein